MTTEQKNRIVALREAGYGYTAVARELGLNKNTVCSYCHKIGLAGVKNNLQLPESRVNVEEPKPDQETCKVTYHFANEPNEAAVTEVLRILLNL